MRARLLLSQARHRILVCRDWGVVGSAREKMIDRCREAGRGKECSRVQKGNYD